MVDGEDGRANQQREKNLRTRVKEKGERRRERETLRTERDERDEGMATCRREVG